MKKNKQGNILQHNEDRHYFEKFYTNYDYLMIKGSNATGLNSISKSMIKELMLFSFLTSLVDQYSFLNVFRYLTFRTAGLSVVTSLIIVFIGAVIKFFLLSI